MKNEDLDIRTAKEIVEAQNKSLRKAIPQGYIFTLIYGLAWFVGYGALAITKLSKVGFIIFGSSLLVGTLIAIFYLLRTLRGVKTKNSKYIAWWAVSWCLGFLIHFSLITALSSVLVNQDKNMISRVSWIVGNSVPLLIVTLCLLGAATIFKDKLTGKIALTIGITTLISPYLKPSLGAMVFSLAGLIMVLFSIIDLYYKKNKKG